jgi:alanine racemase
MSAASQTILHVNLNKLEQNFNYLKAKLKPETKIIGVVKAFAYGHGDVEVSKKLEKLGVYALWVSDYEEGVSLRKSGVKTKIIIANPVIKSYSGIIKYKLDVVLYNYKLLDFYCSNKNDISIHIKFNTGMNRYGFNANEVEPIASKIQNNTHLNLDSICSHLAVSDNIQKKDCTLKQIESFKSISQKFELLLNKKINNHLLNSHGVLNFTDYQMNSVRLGIGLYGSTSDGALKQISCLYSSITQIRDLERGESVGYGGSFIAEKKMKIAIVPVGYADGINRRFGNTIGSVFINNYECNIIGEISMDSFVIDITKCKVIEGDLVELFGDQMTVSKIAKKINTIPYEIYSTLNRRIKRVYSDS